MEEEAEKEVTGSMLFSKYRLRKTLTPYCAAVIAAAGSSQRMGGEDKLFCELMGEPVLLRTLRAFQDSECVDEIIVVTREESVEAVARLCVSGGITKATKILKGGKTRLESVLAGVTQAPKKARLIAVQDGARPLVTGDIIKEAVIKAVKYGAAAPAVELSDTVKEVKDRFAASTPERSSLRAVQTPQVFNADILRGALESAVKNGLEVTDDASAVEAIGGSVYLTVGSRENIKITTPTDLAVAEAILRGRAQ